MTGRIVKALSGFYYVDLGDGSVIPCRGRGKLRHQRITPLVGDRVEITVTEDGTGMVDAVHSRKNQFQRPAVANIDQMVIVCSGAVPVTDPFLIDRMAAMAEWKNCEPLIVFNKFPVAGGLVADTPGFSSFDVEQLEAIPKGELAAAFREFAPHLNGCRFQGCAHVKGRGCAVRKAMEVGEIAPSRYRSYVRLYEQAKEIPDWKLERNQ